MGHPGRPPLLSGPSHQTRRQGQGPHQQDRCGKQAQHRSEHQGGIDTHPPGGQFLGDKPVPSPHLPPNQADRQQCQNVEIVAKQEGVGRRAGPCRQGIGHCQPGPSHGGGAQDHQRQDTAGRSHPVSVGGQPGREVPSSHRVNGGQQQETDDEPGYQRPYGHRDEDHHRLGQRQCPGNLGHAGAPASQERRLFGLAPSQQPSDQYQEIDYHDDK